MRLTDKNIRPGIPKAACPISGYVWRRGEVSKQRFKRIPVKQVMIPKMNRMARLHHPPCLSAYGVERSPIPHSTLIAAFL